MKILLDTNIALDYILCRETNIKNAEKVFEWIYSGKIIGALTANSITDIYYIARKRLGNDNIKKLIYNLLLNFYILSVSGLECLEAIRNQMPDFEDAIVVACAEKDNSDYIVTNDEEFLKTEYSSIPVISLNEFVNKIK